MPDQEDRKPERAIGDTALLGEFGVFEARLVLDLLAEHGILAFPKSPLGEEGGFTYEVVRPGRPAILFVERAQRDEARRVLSQELPARLREIEREMTALAGEGPSGESDQEP
ncbi:MAG: hypothetical protein HY775_07880 [Acidobacteria bacterium]|nr:hypothetical protein [Acidobacteriota bacterium]